MESDETKKMIALVNDAETWLVGFKPKPAEPGEMTQMLQMVVRKIEKKALWNKRRTILLCVAYAIGAIIYQFAVR